MWIRIDFDSNDSKFIDTNMDLRDFSEAILKKNIVLAKRSLVLFPHESADKRQGLVAMQLKDLHPVYAVCKEEWINTKFIKSFGVVDESSNAWKAIIEKALGEKHILTPNKELIL